MALQLIEFVPERPEHEAVDRLIAAAAEALAAGGAELIEAQVPRDLRRVFLIAEEREEGQAGEALRAGGIVFEDVARVRLVGADLAEVKASAGTARYLVEWDLPEGLSMDSDLARKREKSPRYAEVPETRFLRTYVREDMGKCLCLYDAPDVAAVERARKAVEAPIDRLHELREHA